MPNPSGLTPVYAFPYLLESDVPDVATASQDLAQAVENILKGMRVGTYWVGATSTLPSGVVLCDGSVVSQLGTYAALFAVIGTAYNTGGEGAGNFRLPSASGRVLMGSGTGAGLTPRTLAQTFGEETHQLVVSEVPALSGTTNNNATQHNHDTPTDTAVESPGSTLSVVPTSSAPAGSVGISFGQQVTSAENAEHDHTFSTTGGGGTHNNIQPTLVATVGIWYA